LCPDLLLGAGKKYLDPEEEETLRALQELLREILLDRGYALAENRLALAAVIENAFPYVEVYRYKNELPSTTYIEIEDIYTYIPAGPCGGH